VSQMSVGFVVGEDEWNRSGTARAVTRIERLIDVSAVRDPASTTTSGSAGTG